MSLSGFESQSPPTAGEGIDNYAVKLLAEAEAARATRIALFNECPVIALPGDTLDEVLGRWHRLFNESRKAYERTPEHAEFQARNRAWRHEVRQTAEKLMLRLSVIDKSDIGKVLAVVEKSHCLGYDFTSDLAAEYVKALREAGYEPNVNIGDDFQPDDAENAGRYIIGQAMTMPGHGIATKFCAEWREKFGGMA